jgi:hypothetical protein
LCLFFKRQINPFAGLSKSIYIIDSPTPSVAYGCCYCA